jgi:hypothetical protein
MRTAPISTRVADREPNIGYVRTRPSLAKEQLGGAGCVFGIDIVRMLAVARVLAPGIDWSEGRAGALAGPGWRAVRCCRLLIRIAVLF